MKPNFIDWWIYRLFWWRWNKIFASNRGLLVFFMKYTLRWIKEKYPKQFNKVVEEDFHVK